MSVTQAGPSTPQPRTRRRKLLWNAAGLLIALGAVVGTLVLWANSSQFADMVRSRLSAELQKATGGRVEIASFHWHPLDLEAEAGGIVIHGDEPATEAPYVQVKQLRARASILGLWWTPRLLLRDLQITRPQMHLILYRDGTTNQPHPAKARRTSGSGIETLFRLQAGHVAVDQGLIDIDDRAADALDVQNRYEPLDFRGDDLSVVMRYVPASGNSQEAYRIDAGIKDLNLSRGGTLKNSPVVHGYVSGSLDLTGDAARLSGLRVTARTKGAPDRTLDINGSLVHFARPQWTAKLSGDLDLRLLDPVLGYPNAPEGIAHLNLLSGGAGREFHIDGTVNADNAAYIGTGVTERGIGLSTHVHADNRELRITQVAARLKQGGEIDGEVLLQNWLPASAAPVVMEPATPQPPSAHIPLRKRLGRALHRQPSTPPAPPQVPPHSTLVKSPPSTIPVNGRVNAFFKNVSVDTVLDMVSRPPFQRLGIQALLNGPAIATWTHGDVDTLAVSSSFGLTPSGRAVSGEAPANGVIDATYTQKDGAVDLRRLELNLPSSHFIAQGHLGAYPLTSPTALRVDFHSGNLAEFDTVFRDLGLTANGKSGAAALPIGVNGQADFRGTWEGSLESPRMNGQLQATQVAVELPPSFNSSSGQPQVLRWDTIEAEGSYDAERVSIVHGQLRRGNAEIVVNGTLTAGQQALAARKGASGGEMPAFDDRAILRMQARASGITAGDLLPLAGIDAPITGAVDAQIAAEGPLHAIGGSGSLTLKDGSVYGEPITTILLQGSFAQQQVRLDNLVATSPAGRVSAHGSYDLGTKRMQFEADTSGLELGRVERFRAALPDTTGRLGFQFTVAGTRNEPQITGHGSIEGLTVDGQSLGELNLKAHTANNALIYDASTHYDTAAVSVQGQTELRGNYATQAKLDFTRFDIGTLFQIAHMEGITGQSALSGTASIAGPLAKPMEMRGDLRLQQMAMMISGVHLTSDGGLHAALDNGRVTLDPLHLTGDDTDLRAQGSLSLKDTRRIDFGGSGAINLKLVQMLAPTVTATGETRFQVEAHGPLANPDLRGKVEIQNASLAREDLPNSLSQIRGTLEFNQNRLEVRSVTAMSGGGQLSIGGYLAFQHGLFANLTVSAHSVRVRYPAGVSSQADANLQVQGPETNLLLSGNVLITRFSISPDFDIASLASGGGTVQQVAAPTAASNRVRLDVRIQSSPQLNFQNAYAKLAGDVDLRLRGTLATPSLQGRISITEGNATIAGTRYELQRGDITFTNPVRIQPNIDLSATARVEDYDISLGLHGTPDKMNVSYRSDPPLPEADVVALLALGRTQSEQGLYTQQQQQSAGVSTSTDVLLGGALNATVSSRVQKLFGAGSVKVDPSYLGALGNSTTRITVEEQLGKNVALIYATNVNTTAQQLLQADIAINRHVSLQVTRDESGVFSMVIKAIRRYR